MLSDLGDPRSSRMTRPGGTWEEVFFLKSFEYLFLTLIALKLLVPTNSKTVPPDLLTIGALKITN